MNLTGFKSSASSDGSLKLPYWTKGETNAFFGLGFNILVNVLTLTALLLFVVQMPAASVLGTVLPALGIAMLVGNVYYTFLARRLARKENRTDVTALPYGPSVPHMFIVVFVIMLPIFLSTGDPVRAWEAGLAWAFIIGVIVLIGAFIGPFIRKITPRAAMLGTLAGISITFISMRPAAQIWDAAWIGLPVLGIILVGFFTNMRLPGGIPVGLAALLVGTAIGWIGGYMSVPDVQAAVSQIAFAVPSLHFDLLFTGLGNLAPLLATAIPLGVYNFAEAMSNVESAAAAGDSYNLRSVLLADGAGAIVGSALGSPFPPAVYIGLLIGAQAFQSVPKIQAAAVVAAILPNLAQWGTGLIDNALAAAGTSADQVGEAALTNAGLVYHGLKVFGEGAVLAGMVLGSIVAFLLMRNFYASAAAAGVGAALSWIGLIHAEQVQWAARPQVALGYAMLAIVLLAFAVHKRNEPASAELDPEVPAEA